MFTFFYNCLTSLTRQKTIIKIIISGIINADVLKWITEVKCGWQFDCFPSLVSSKYQDYAIIMIKMEHMNPVKCSTLNINNRLHLQKWCRLDSLRLWHQGKPLGLVIFIRIHAGITLAGSIRNFLYLRTFFAGSCTQILKLKYKRLSSTVHLQI